MECPHTRHVHFLIKLLRQVQAIIAKWGIFLLMDCIMSIYLIADNKDRKISLEYELEAEIDPKLKVSRRSRLQPFCVSLVFLVFQVHSLTE